MKFELRLKYWLEWLILHANIEHARHRLVWIPEIQVSSKSAKRCHIREMLIDTSDASSPYAR
jgi:hypothetical protein